MLLNIMIFVGVFFSENKCDILMYNILIILKGSSILYLFIYLGDLQGSN